MFHSPGSCAVMLSFGIVLYEDRWTYSAVAVTVYPDITWRRLVI